VNGCEGGMNPARCKKVGLSASGSNAVCDREAKALARE